MAVNFVLRDRFGVGADDPMGRTWVGWDPYRSDDELWAANRGLWTLANGAVGQRWATLSYRGVIQVVAEISGRERFAVGDGDKWALVGEVLLPGDPVRDALVGTAPPPGRNPVGYFDTSSLDRLSSAARCEVSEREPATMLATWNPARWSSLSYEDDVSAIAAGAIVRGQWSTGSRRNGIEPGDRVFLLRQGTVGRGIVGSGTCASRIFRAGHWDGQPGHEACYVLVDWDTLVAPSGALDRAELMARIPAGGEWRPQGSGTLLSRDAAAALELLWARHLGLREPVPPRTSPRQGWQMDSARRRKVEDAAQERLTRHYEEDDWTVKDTRHGNPFDAIATKGGRVHYLEAKGTETAGSSVIVTRGEVNWARNHPGQCMVGILSNIKFLPNGEVDPSCGDFRIFPWDPDSGRLAPRDYDWTPVEPDLGA